MNPGRNGRYEIEPQGKSTSDLLSQVCERDRTIIEESGTSG